MLGEDCAYFVQDFFEHELSIFAMLISTSIPSKGSFGGKAPNAAASFHIAVKSLRALLKGSGPDVRMNSSSNFSRVAEFLIIMINYFNK